jgi:hypothetical protein
MWCFAALFFGAEKCANFSEEFCGKAHFLSRYLSAPSYGSSFGFESDVA